MIQLTTQPTTQSATQLIDILDTAVKIGLGALIAGAFAYFVERARLVAEIRKERRTLHREWLIEPIRTFVDDYLAFVSESYWSRAEHEPADPGERLVNLRNREAGVEARVATLRDPELLGQFKGLTSTEYLVRVKYEQGGMGPAAEQKDKAVKLASAFLSTLVKRVTASGGAL